MNVRKLIVVCLIGIVSVCAVGAQENTTPTIVLENGISAGYSVANNTIGTALRLGLGVALTDTLRVNLSFLSNQATFRNYQLLSLDYSFIPTLGASVYVGQDSSTPLAVTGLGIYSTVLGKTAAGSLQTGLRIRLDYLSPVTTGFQNGYLALSATMLIGM